MHECVGLQVLRAVNDTDEGVLGGDVLVNVDADDEAGYNNAVRDLLEEWVGIAEGGRG